MSYLRTAFPQPLSEEAKVAKRAEALVDLKWILKMLEIDASDLALAVDQSNRGKYPLPEEKRNMFFRPKRWLTIDSLELTPGTWTKKDEETYICAKLTALEQVEFLIAAYGLTKAKVLNTTMADAVKSRPIWKRDALLEASRLCREFHITKNQFWDAVP